ncbi:L-threonine 3-dehydrogenase [ANME-1 cluster archaeon GoMg2]|nr:L-threonine 3-dehydrogenase [ANME-1 cluster archaeon GoMg2]
MKAAVLVGIEDLEIVDIDIPSCSPGDILIRVEACAICKTDVKMFHVGHRDLKLPRVLGHEVAGTIVEVGAEVVDTFESGDRVQVAPGLTCGSCPFCVSGVPNMCDCMKILGFHRDGGFAEYMLVPANGVRNGCVNKIPPSLSFEVASLAEPLACCINAQTLCRIRPDDTVAIIGAGPIGHLNAQLARLLGASKVIIVEKSPQRIEFAERNNIADVIIDSRENDIVDVIREETNNSGVDVVIPACADPEVPVQGLKMLNKRGRIVFFSGLPYGYENICFDHNQIHYKEIQIFGAYGCTSEQNREAVRLLSAGRLKVKYLITHRITLHELTNGFEMIDTQNAMEVVVKIL